MSALTPDSILPVSLPLLISKARPGSVFFISGSNSYNGLQWQDASPKPTFEEILQWIEEIPVPSQGDSILGDLRPYVNKAMLTSAHNAFALMLTLFSARMNPELLSGVVAAVRAGMPQDFTESEIAEINRILFKYGISVELE